MKSDLHNGCRTILEAYVAEIKQLSIHTEKPLKELEKGITICKTYIQRLREKVLNGCIQSPEEEIYFFKYIKPSIVGDCLFFHYLLDIPVMLTPSPDIDPFVIGDGQRA
jgi:hypothetical protein